MKTLALLLLLTGCGHDDTKTDAHTLPNDASTPVVTAEKGDRGETGATGPVGPAGPRGDTGETGTAGTNGKDAEPLTTNEWFDPITKTYWLISAEHVWETDICGVSNEWSLPTLVVLEAAVDHGMFIASHDIGGPSTAWTIEPDSGGHIAIGASITGATGDNVKNGIFCERKK